MYANAIYRYSAYKPSAVPWLGDVPAHWEVVQLGRIGVFSKGSGGTKDDEVPDGIPCVRYGDLYTTHTHFIRRTRSYVSLARASAYTPINRGDVLFPTSGETIEDIGKSAVNLMHTQVFCGGDLIIFRPTVPMEPKFAGYSLDCHSAQTQKSLMGRGITIMHVHSAQLKYFRVSLPHLSEQASIVRYLDHVDRRIRRYVSAKRKLIAVLEEEKQAIVNQAVTRGLDPNVRLKPSGVEWLGDVPEHWETTRFSRQVDIAEGQVDPEIEPYSSMLLIAPNHLESKTGRLLYRETASEQAAISGKYFCLAGDVIYSKIRPALAKVLVAPADCLCSADMYPLRPRNSLLNVYLFWLMLSEGFTAWSVLESDRVAMPKINRETLTSLHLPIPPLSEQAAIVQHLDEATAIIYAAIARARRQIELLQEYRTRLISDVVTGKLDVSEAAALLPDEADDEEPMDEGGPLADSVAEDLHHPDEWPEELAMESEVTV